jgi:hypothetical protein
MRRLGEPLQHFIDGALVLGEVLQARVGNGVHLLAPFLDRGAREAMSSSMVASGARCPGWAYSGHRASSSSLMIS